MKTNKKIIITSIITSLVVGLFIYILINPHHYILEVHTGSNYNYASGVLTKNAFKGSFFLDVNFDNPNEHCTVGLFIYDEDTKDLKLLESTGGINETGECQAIQTQSGYSVTNKTFMRREKSYHNGNIINQMANNKENTYLCISKKDLVSLTIDDCFKVEFEEYK